MKKIFAVQTVFEGYDYNSQDKLRKNQLEWGLKIPMAQTDNPLYWFHLRLLQ